MSKRLFIICCLLSLVLARGGALASARALEDFGAVRSIPRAEIDGWVRSEISRHGGQFDTERYHFVVGFSTGHFGSDPVHAIAMRRVAFTILNKTMAPGDSVTPVAWEMGVWHVGPTIGLTEDPQTRARFVSTVPYAPRHGSRGGHDVERSLHEILTQVVLADRATGTVILLITNSNQSQGPVGGGEPLVGSNYPPLQQALSELGYAPPVRHTFTAKSRDGQRDLVIDITALFPATMAGLPGTPATRRVAFPERTWQPPGDRPTLVPRWTMWQWLGALLVLAAAIALLVWAVRATWNVLQKRSKQRALKAAAGRRLPGQLRITLGSGSSTKEVKVDELNSTGRWLLLREAGGQLSFMDRQEHDEEESTAEIVAQATFDSKRLLRVQAEGSYEFSNLLGHVKASNAHLLVLAPGEQLLATPTEASSGVRLPLTRIQYRRKG